MGESADEEAGAARGAVERFFAEEDMTEIVPFEGPLVSFCPPTPSLSFQESPIAVRNRWQDTICLILFGISGLAHTAFALTILTLAKTVGALLVVFMNAEKVPWAFSAILTEAFNSSAMSGEILGIM